MNLYIRTLKILKPFWKQLVIASSSAAAHAIFSGLLVWMVGPLLMTLFQLDSLPGVKEAANDPATASNIVRDAAASVSSFKESMKLIISGLVEAETRQETLINFCWLILVVAVAKNLFLYLQGFFMAYVQQSIIRLFRNSLFEKYQRLSLAYFHKRRTGQIISRVTNDVMVLNDSIDVGFNRLVTDSIMAIVFFTFLLILSWKLTLLSMVIMPVVFGFIWWIGGKLRKYSERSQERMADVNSVLEEAINNVRIVKAFSMEKFESKRFFAATREYFRSLLRMTRIRHVASPINDILATLAGLLILLFAGSKIISGTGELDAGDFMTFILALFAMIKPVKSLSQVHIKLQEGMAAAERVYRVLDADEKIRVASDAKTLKRFEQSVRYEKVHFSYNEGEEVLTDISFEVKRGEVIAFVGPSGGGKSTLLDLLPRFYDPRKGTIIIDGHDIKSLTLESLRGLMGIVTQETYLFNDTIRNNIAYGLESISDKRVQDAAKMANIHDFIATLEKGYDTQVGNRGIMLSGGQRQRLAIARALLKDPQILIFDEATSALDTESELLVQEAIERLMANRTTFVIAHRLSTIKTADRILVIDSGKIVDTGTHAQLIEREGIYKKLYKMQFRDKDEHPVS